ncbi:hypothetical protein JAAARDRAFT_122432, partial [Jaapia argillacea MUCL 33604]
LRNSSLEGFKIPGTKERLIAMLFADDTTTYLSENDSFEDLMKILNDWCIAAKAKFNVKKTEIVPVGLQEFREQLIKSRQIQPDGPPIPQEIHIAREGEAVRILGVWFGNKMEAGVPWAPVMEKVDKALQQWDRSHPTMEGRCLIIQMVIGGMTQYLTQVQGMPAPVEDCLVKRTRKFMWGDKTQSPVNLKTLYAPVSQGGRGVLDL